MHDEYLCIESRRILTHTQKDSEKFKKKTTIAKLVNGCLSDILNNSHKLL